MNPIWTAILTFVSTSLLVFSLALLIYDTFFRYRLTVRERMNALFEGLGQDHEVSLFKDIARLQAEEFESLRTWKERLHRIIDESGIQCSIPTLLTWSVAAGTIVGLGGACHSVWLGAVLFPVGLALPFVALLTRRQRRQRKLSRQLPEAFAMISRGSRRPDRAVRAANYCGGLRSAHFH